MNGRLGFPGLVSTGLLLLAAGLAAYIYPTYGQWDHDRQNQRPPDIRIEGRTSDAELVPTDTPTPLIAKAVGEEVNEVLAAIPTAALPTAALAAEPVDPQPRVASATPLPTRTPTATPLPTPSPTSYGQPVWMVIPSIKVDAKVLEMGMVNGEYVIPGWEVGHHVDSPYPGDAGNSAYVGHVSTLKAGSVFSRLKDVKIADEIHIYTERYHTTWLVTDLGVYSRDDASFLAPSLKPRVTLYTCTGTFDLGTRDFSHRLAVSADLVGAELRPQTKR